MAEKRITLQDKVNKNNFYFSQPTAFEKAFPMIEDIKVKSVEKGYGVETWNESRTFGKDSLGEFINCRNRSCQRGGFDIGIEIWDMVRKKETTRKKLFICEGDEGSLKGRKIGRHCINHLNAEITIKYKEVPKATSKEEVTESPTD